jgi:hypothetical protein
MNRAFSVSAIAGGALWGLVAIGLLPIPRSEFIELLFLTAPLVVVPLGLSLARPARSAAVFQPMGAVAAVTSFALPIGPEAGIVALAWLASTAVPAFAAVARMARRPRRPIHDLAIDVAQLNLAAGAAALAVARAGFNPLGFPYLLILLFAVHFHFAGFAAPLLAGLAGRAMPDRKLLRAAIVGVMTGPPIVAFGFAFAPVVELAGAALLTASVAITGLHMMGQVRPRAAGLLILVSALSAISGMIPAVLYAWGEFAGAAIFDIPRMARWHGITLAFGFAFCGLLGWRLLLTEDR